MKNLNVFSFFNQFQLVLIMYITFNRYCRDAENVVNNIETKLKTVEHLRISIIFISSYHQTALHTYVYQESGECINLRDI